MEEFTKLFPEYRTQKQKESKKSKRRKHRKEKKKQQYEEPINESEWINDIKERILKRNAGVFLDSSIFDYLH